MIHLMNVMNFDFYSVILYSFLETEKKICFSRKSSKGDTTWAFTLIPATAILLKFLHQII